MRWLPSISSAIGIPGGRYPILYAYPCTDTYLYFSLRRSAESFHKADNLRKRNHSDTLSALLRLIHVLPLACRSEAIITFVFLQKRCEWTVRNFHAEWTLDGWNDHMIQPARDAVLHYYQACPPNISPHSPCTKHIQFKSIYCQCYAEPLDIEKYMRRNGLF